MPCSLAGWLLWLAWFLVICIAGAVIIPAHGKARASQTGAYWTVFVVVTVVCALIVKAKTEPATKPTTKSRAKSR